MASFLLARTTDPTSGLASYDLVISPAGGYAMVSGLALLGQNILLYMDTRRGTHPTDPNFGVELLDDLGQPYPTDDPEGHFDAMLRECEAYFLGVQAQNPNTPLDEQLASIDTAQVALDNTTQIGRVILSFQVNALSGDYMVVTF